MAPAQDFVEDIMDQNWNLTSETTRTAAAQYSPGPKRDERAPFRNSHLSLIQMHKRRFCMLHRCSSTPSIHHYCRFNPPGRCTVVRTKTNWQEPAEVFFNNHSLTKYYIGQTFCTFLEQPLACCIRTSWLLFLRTSWGLVTGDFVDNWWNMKRSKRDYLI